ncbi:MAG: sulfatase-like hydrolase/transferase, partial [Planctomycetaceae bacterium]|nr:sulfatase-like hydrolase/transferase [Planctomycetaceae bacterium]
MLLAIVAGLIVWWQRQPAAVNVLLITLDTTRADRIGCYGHAGAQTPAINALAARGVLFEQPHTPVPLTLPAHSSLLTGLLPPEHGVRLNGAARLDSAIPTLTGALRDAGYRTGAFVAAIVLARRHGLDSGFETYDDDLSLAEPNPDQSHLYRDGRHVIDAALHWLEHGDSRPTFCWVHLYDPHDPYLEHADEFGNEFQGRAYDAEIAYADRQIARLVDHLRSAGTLENTLIVIAGDHGESLGEHGEQTHGYMVYEPATRVPLIVAGPGVPTGRREAEPVSLVDVFPTVCELLRLPSPAEISGRSLAAAFNDLPLEAIPAYAETMQPIHEANWAPLQSISTDGWKYIRTRRPELYHLANDAGEANDLSSAEPERVASMEAALQDLESRLQIREAAATALAPEERRALESLGYVAGSATAAQSPHKLDELHDMKDMIGHLNDYRAAVELLHERRWEEAAAILVRVTAAAPDYFKAQTNLGTCYAQLQRFDEAATAFERAIALQPGLET